MNNYVKSKHRQHPISSITALHSKLFHQLHQIDQKYPTDKHSDDSYLEFQEQSAPHNNQLLHKARNIQTYNNRGKLQRLKREIKQCNQYQDQAFVTGVGLFIEQKQAPKEDWKQINEDELFRNLNSSQQDDLAELRRMIKKTEVNLKSYSRSVYNIKNQIVNAADKYGNSIDVGLAIKINKCGFQNSYDKQPKYSMNAPKTAQTIKKRAMSSHIVKKHKP